MSGCRPARASVPFTQWSTRSDISTGANCGSVSALRHTRGMPKFSHVMRALEDGCLLYKFVVPRCTVCRAPHRFSGNAQRGQNCVRTYT